MNRCLALLLLLGLLPPVTSEAFASPASCPEGEDWPRFLGPRGDGSSCETILKAWPDEGPPLLWHRAVGEGYSAPAVVDDRVLVFDRVDDDARLTAYRAEDGEPLWQASYPTAYEDLYGYSGGPRTSPVIDDGRVFTFGVEGRLRAHSLTDGELLWDIDTAETFGVVQNFFGVGSTPVIEGDLLIALVGGSPPDSPGIQSGNVQANGSAFVAFDKRTGEIRYQFGDELASYSSPVVRDINGQRVGLALTRGGLLAFDPAEGAQLAFQPWRAKKLESVNAATPIVVSDTVLITEAYGPGGALFRFSGKAWTAIWTDPPRGKALECHWSTPVVLGRTVYASSGQASGEAELRAVDLATGQVSWSEPGLGRSTILLVDGHLVVLTERGRLLLVKASPERFELVAEHDFGRPTAGDNAAAKAPSIEAGTQPVLRFPTWNAPVLSRGRLYLRGKDRLLVLDVGEPSWKTTSQRP